MVLDPLGAIGAASRPVPPASSRASLQPVRALVIGGAGRLGSAVLEQVLSAGHAQVLLATTQPMQMALRGLQPLMVSDWAAVPSGLADLAVIVFDQDLGAREDAVLMPQPQDLLPIAQALHSRGVRSLAVVLPHAPSMLPAALQQGLNNLDEQAVAALGFERLLFVRPTQQAGRGGPAQALLPRLAAWMLSQMNYMLPARERPLRPAIVARFVVEALKAMSPGTHIAAAQILWEAAQAEIKGERVEDVARRWAAQSV